MKEDISSYNKAKKGAWVGIWGNFILGGVKIVVGFVGGSYALITDGIHSLSDITSSVAVLLGLVIASKPKDRRHPYGHGRAESIASLSIAVLLMAFAIFIIYESLVAIITSENLVEPSVVTLWVAVLAVALKEGMYQYKMRLGKKLKSTSLMADAWHHRSDAFSSIIVAISIALAIYGGRQLVVLDKLGAIAVALIIIYMAVEIYKKAAAELMDESVDADMFKKIKKSALGVSGVKKVETLLVRKSGLYFLVDIHIEVEPDMSVTDSHDIATSVKDRITRDVEEVKSVLVHVEPHEE